MAWTMPATRAASTPPSSTVAASSSRPRMKWAVPSVGTSVGSRMPRRAPDRERALGVRDRVDEAVEVELAADAR